MIKVYTSIDGLKLNNNVCVFSYTQLNDKVVDWVNCTVLNNTKNSTFAERKFASILREQPHVFFEQAYFMINGKSYFLDFFIPDLNLAFEINGSVHKRKKDYDLQRDMDFDSIGIKTIRLTNREVYLKNIREILNKYVRETLNGTFDASDYYVKPILNKFDGKLTTNQKAIVVAINEISKIKDGSRVLIKTNMTYLTYVLNHMSDEKVSFCDNRNFIIKFNDLVKDKKLIYDIVYTGDLKRLNYPRRQHASKLNETDLYDNNDVVLVVNGSNINDYSDNKFAGIIKKYNIEY